MTDDPRLTITDFRRVYCVAGIKARMESAGVDFRGFLQNGALASDLKGLGYDGMVERVVVAKRDAENG